VYGGGKIIFGIFGDYIKAVDYTGTQIWETENDNFISSPGSIAYSDLHGTYGFYTGEENGRMNGYDAGDGSVLAGWPTNYLWGGQERHTPALYDLDGDGLLENISASGSTSSGVAITAVHQDATVYWNTYIPKGEVDTYPAVGDVDNDGSVDIIVVGSESISPFRSEVFVLSATGEIERSWLLGSGVPYGTAPALADLNGDRVPEIIVQTDGYVYAMDGYGNELPGWPYSLGSYYWIGNSSPVIGDVDGDYKPEIVFTSYDYYHTGSPSYFYILNHDGTDVSGFPMRIDYIDHGAVPAIADIDRDCHNEVIITGDFWDGYTGYYPTVWAFDLSRMSPGINLGGIKAHGNIEWGQFMSNASHTGVYSPVRTICITSNPADPM